MVRVDLSEVVIRRMKEEDIEVVKELIKVCFCEGHGSAINIK